MNLKNYLLSISLTLLGSLVGCSDNNVILRLNYQPSNGYDVELRKGQTTPSNREAII